MKKRDFILALLAAPGLAFAHAGHGASQVSVSVEVIKRRKDTLHLMLTLLNKGAHTVILDGAEVQGADVLSANWAKVPSGALVDIPVSLQFNQSMPSSFTLLMDFGTAGELPVMVRL